MTINLDFFCRMCFVCTYADTKSSVIFGMCEEEFGDTKGVIIIRKSKDRRYTKYYTEN